MDEQHGEEIGLHRRRAMQTLGLSSLGLTDQRAPLGFRQAMQQDSQYQVLLADLEMRWDGVLSRQEIDTACKSMFPQYPRPGIETMQLLLAGKENVVRHFLREVAKLV